MGRLRKMRRNKRRDTRVRNMPCALGIAGIAAVLAVVLKDRRRMSDRIHTFNKHIFNPLMLKSASSPHSPFGVIRDIGRRSGKVYETPILVVPVVDGFVIALTYRPGVDWYRNTLAAGQCTMLWHGREYVSEESGALDAKTAVLAFPPILRPMLRILGSQHVLKMKYWVVVPA